VFETGLCSVIASEAKQSIGQRTAKLDCSSLALLAITVLDTSAKPAA
jgi:hypothetical protein